MGLRPHSYNDCIQEVARVEEEDGDGGWVALWRPSRTPPNRGRLSQSAEWGGAGVASLVGFKVHARVGGYPIRPSNKALLLLKELAS